MSSSDVSAAEPCAAPAIPLQQLLSPAAAAGDDGTFQPAQVRGDEFPGLGITTSATNPACCCEWKTENNRCTCWMRRESTEILVCFICWVLVGAGWGLALEPLGPPCRGAEGFWKHSKPPLGWEEQLGAAGELRAKAALRLL